MVQIVIGWWNFNGGRHYTMKFCGPENATLYLDVICQNSNRRDRTRTSKYSKLFIGFQEWVILTIFFISVWVRVKNKIMGSITQPSPTWWDIFRATFEMLIHDVHMFYMWQFGTFKFCTLRLFFSAFTNVYSCRLCICMLSCVRFPF